jgi:uncharacterized protein with HEPN domain
MQISVRDAAALWDMVQAIKKIQEFTIGRSEADYLGNELLQSAVERKLEILGEAARRISAEFQAQHQEIDWRNTIGPRNIIAHQYDAHQYDEVQQENIWKIVQTPLSDLLALLEPLLPPIEEYRY